MRKEFIIAEKEFRDHLTSKRFLVFFAIVLILAVVGMIGGLDNYHIMLDQYKTTVAQNAKDPNHALMIAQMQQQLQNMTSSGADSDTIEQMQYQIEDAQSPIMPSIITVYYSITNPFYMVGMFLAMIIGFDILTKEKDEGTLKSLLSRPLYRDSLINGKAIAAVALIAVVLACTFLVTGAVLLLNNIVPQGDDLARMVALYLVTMLYMVAFFAISMMVSALSKNTSMALLVSICIIVVLYELPSVSSPIITAVIGDWPQYPQTNYDPNGDPVAQQQLQEQQQKQYQQLQQDYYNKETLLNDVLNGISPEYQYSEIAGALSTRTPQGQLIGTDYLAAEHKSLNRTVWQSLADVWVGLLVILVEIVVAFAVSYVKFLRMDIR